jgi:hypothetical protein
LGSRADAPRAFGSYGRSEKVPDRKEKRVRVALISLAFLTASVTAPIAAPSTSASARATNPPTWAKAVTGICAHALLFDGRHQIGTRAGAVAVARDIRASTARRLRRVQALRIQPPNRRLSDRWLRLERRLAGVHATSYVRIYDAIAAAKTPRQRARLPRVLGRLLHVPDALRFTAESVEERLHVPDCTGGERRTTNEGRQPLRAT